MLKLPNSPRTSSTASFTSTGVITTSFLTRSWKLPSTACNRANGTAADWPCVSQGFSASGVTRPPTKSTLSHPPAASSAQKPPNAPNTAWPRSQGFQRCVLLGVPSILRVRSDRSSHLRIFPSSDLLLNLPIPFIVRPQDGQRAYADHF